jgi:hypothetical protein
MNQSYGQSYGQGYAQINPSLNYNTAVPKNGNFEEYPSFSKYQDDMNYKGEEYYCGGNSSLAIGGLQMENSPVSELYFSRENMKRIQKQIKREVYNESEGKFNLKRDQDETDLLVAMRAVFLDNAKNLPTNIVRQVKELNKLTLDYIIPDMMTNIKQQVGYLRDISRPPDPIARPINVNRAGRKTLPSSTTIWGF